MQNDTNEDSTAKRLTIWMSNVTRQKFVLGFVIFQIAWLCYYQKPNVPSIANSQTTLSFHEGTVDYKEADLLLPVATGTNQTLLSIPRTRQRPPQTHFSHSFEDAIRDAEQAYYGPNIDDPEARECIAWGGTGVINMLKQSKTTHLPQNSLSQLESYSARPFDIFVAKNAVLQVKNNPKSSQSPPEISLLLSGKDPRDRKIEDRIRLVSGDTLLAKATQKLQFVGGEKDLPACDHIINHPVFLIDSDGDHWNWWFFHLEQLSMFVVYTILQPELAENYMATSPQMAYILPYDRYNRPMTDGLELLFTPNRELDDSLQIWNPNMTSTNVSATNYCFRDRVIWTPGSRRYAGSILRNRSHELMKCFSSIVTAYAAHLKSSLHIPTLPSYHAIPYVKNVDVGSSSSSSSSSSSWKPKPRVVWVGRDNNFDGNFNSWQKQRMINNQDEVTQFLQEKCLSLGIEMEVAKFYGDIGSQTSYQEQAHFVSRANILIGVHGAGLNLGLFMPFNSVIVEIHMGSNVQKNSENTIAHLGGGKYMMMNGRKDRDKNLDKGQAWEQLEKAILEWEKLQIERGS